MDEATEYEAEEPRFRRVPSLEPVIMPAEERGELPVSLVDGVLRVGSSYALAGVASFWTPYAPVAEARCGWEACCKAYHRTAGSGQKRTRLRPCRL